MSQLPPLRSILKSSDVEDPVNLYLHRTLAYGFVKAVHRTPITPDMITFLTIIPGFLAGAMFLWGTPAAMVAGGLLLWSAAILDGADGLLARAKDMASVYGRAHDGLADVLVAVFTVFPAFAHIWFTTHNPVYLWLMLPTIAFTAVHLTLYDYYKEQYLRATRPERDSEDIGAAELTKLLEKAREKGVITRIAIRHVLLPLAQNQQKLIGWLNPGSWEQKHTLKRNAHVAEVYRRHNLGPMRLWTLISSAPHCYLLAICAISDRLDVYFWLRFGVMNVVMVIAILWQRRATLRTSEELERSSRPDALSAPELHIAAA